MSVSLQPAGAAAPASAPPFFDARDPGPIRAELYGLDRLDVQARALASACALAPPERRSSPLLGRFERDAASLERVHARILAEGGRRENQGLDAEWLSDNFHIIEEVLREVRQDLPPGYDAELPKLATAPLAGFPRAYAVALALVAHSDSEIDEGRITHFVEAFQTVAPLTIGELWALPTMFRLVLLENLRRLADQMLWGWDERQRAELAAAETPGPSAERSEEPSDPFAVRLLQLLRDRGPDAAPALGRLEEQLQRSGHDANEVLHREHRRQAANQVTVGNCVVSLRVLSAIDWNAFFERVSLVEAILREDPSGVYTRQDFATRDRMRRSVEKVARRARRDELDVARRAVAIASQSRGPEPARGHVGDSLIGPGLAALKVEFGYRPSLRERLLDAALARPGLVYFGSIAVLLATFLALATMAGIGGHASIWIVALAVAALLLPASELAVGLVNHFLTLVLPPRVLAKLDFKEGIADDCATIVVMPTMLARPESAAVLTERLEIHFLANPDPQLRFALLTDFSDADSEHRPEDDGFVREALERIKALNARYAAGGPDRFFLFHRKRLWNPSEGCWMGWERKRGKLSEFNRLLRGDRNTSYAVESGDPASLRQIRFVITLDADTQMPRDTAARLVGTIAHPLNQALFDASKGRVVAGHAVLQPRVSFHLTAATHSRFAALLASSGGIDPYSSAASDTYMDLFGRGSFTGKGVYDVDAFEAATGHAFPENHILSHDLIEGNFARCGLLSDTELFDDFPARSHAYARREHRWTRGDWQLLPWLGLRVPTPDGSRPNPLPALERWKLFDNLRRSLVPPALVVLLVLGWTVLPGSPWFWTACALAVPGLPLLQLLIGTLIGCARSGSLSGLKRWREAVPPALGQALLSIAFLASQARNLLDAIVRTLARLFVTHRPMLEWETAATTERRLGTGLRPFLRSMWAAPVLAIALAVVVGYARPEALAPAAPILAAWLLSPVVAYWISQPRRSTEKPLSEPERRELRRIARKTWHFFETFVGETDHWLPPDNYQEAPEGRVAHRTSPTNQGLLLLSTLAAHDLGYIGLGTLADRLEKTLDTFDKMERYRGHFYNWYETTTLGALPPTYLSTVDSGNLLGCLVALKQGLKEKARATAPGRQVAEGLFDTLAQVGGSLEALVAATGDDAGALRRALQEDAATFNDLLSRPPADSEGWDAWFRPIEEATRALVGRLEAVPGAEAGGTEGPLAWARRFEAQVGEHREEWASLRDEGRAADLRHRLLALAGRAEAMAAEMDFRPLYKPERHLYAIGYNLAQGRLDGACYDLLASESSLTSFLTVARGDAPRRHWFQLGRPYIRAAGRYGLISWGGTMFEYLMPRLLIRSLPGTLVAESARTAWARQREFGQGSGIPWGVSESAFNAQYADGDYQYQSFGVPGLGLKRGLENDLVVAPYATALAAMIAPHEALANFRRLVAEGAEGPYGFHEAIDYTPDRLPKGERRVVVRSYMAHHQGMSLVALTNALLDDPMPRRFHAEPMVKAAELLLQERIPADVPVLTAGEFGALAQSPPVPGTATHEPLLSRRLTTPSTPAPRTHLLSNTEYHVMVTNAGSGASTCRGLDVTRWREDPTREGWGQFCYIRDVEHGLVWSAGHQPVCLPTKEYEVTFSADKAAFRRRDAKIETLLEVCVSPEQPAEVRRVTLINQDSRPRTLDVTSYVEVVMAPRAADLAHPAFGKLFLETEWVPAASALLCRRRPRSADQAPVWAVHVAMADGRSVVGEVEYETDRARFLGRGRTPADPAALDPGVALSGTTGPVLDPILSLRRRVHLEPGESTVLAFTTALANTRDEALALADQYDEPSTVARAFDLAWAQSQAEHRNRVVPAEDAHLYQRLASHLLFAGTALRAAPGVLAANRQGQSALWRYGISGDRPIVLASITEPGELKLVRHLVAAHAYLRSKGLEFDLVLRNEEPTSYFEQRNEQIAEAVRAGGAADLVDKPGGIFLRKAAQMPEEDRTLLEAAARAVFVGARGSLADQLDRIERQPILPELLPTTAMPEIASDDPVRLPDGLLFPNGLGGFTPDGREYCVWISAPDRPDVRVNGAPSSSPIPRPNVPPAPWINVVANPTFGFLVSEAGAGTTWAGNSQTNRLTPWSNDPVSDPPGEVVYLRDEETGAVWSPTPLPVLDASPTLVRHGQGYTVFERCSHGLAHELTLFVPPDDPIKLIHLKVRNAGAQRRQLSATFYAEWVLGTTRDATGAHVVTEFDTDTGALLARNAFRGDLGARISFAEVARRPRTVTADRAEFLGRHGTPAAPAALTRRALSGRVGAGLDPCAALQTMFTLEPGEETEVLFLLGEAENAEAARALVRRYREPAQAKAALDEVKARWDAVLGAVSVETPSPAFDLLVNRWLLYQVLSGRVWGRSGFYQSGGAYGFRDQLQDVLALLHGASGEARTQILRASGRQFVEGDVQHWWHPPLGRGVRTRCSDDFLWLPFAVAHYVEATGDAALLDESVPYLSAPALRPGQEDSYGLPNVSDQAGTVYDHCVRALERASGRGPHDLPLIGGGDWNDGMNKVGAGGQGESVWLAWFLNAVLRSFAELVESRGDAERADRWRADAEALRVAVEAHGWDGDWYRRAFYDDGTPLGTAAGDECRIDSIAQTWAILSGVGNPDRARIAFEAVRARLVRPDERLVLLLAPPFDAGPRDPGYIKGYLPGIRENGAQYTHAATWVAQAAAALGQGAVAFDLFELLNPIHHASTPEGVARYKVEPYVLAGDVYALPPHVGRGGWTWYTGSAAWLHRVGLESILGLRAAGDHLAIEPCIPASWPGFEITYRHRTATYRIVVENSVGVERGVSAVTIDGQPCAKENIPLADDGRDHEVRVILGNT